jgi:hypothetical protein
MLGRLLTQHGSLDKPRLGWTRMISLRRRGARLVGISSNQVKLHTDARHAVLMIPVSSAAGVIIPRTILDTGYTSVCRWEIAAAVIAEIPRPGDSL